MPGRIGDITGLPREDAPNTSIWNRRQRKSRGTEVRALYQEWLDAIPEKCKTPDGIAEIFYTLIERMDYIEQTYGILTVQGKPVPMLEVQDIARAIKKHKGNRSKVAEELGIARHRLWEILHENNDLAQLMDDVEEAKVDGIEEKMFEAAMEGSVGERLYIMKAHPKARARGYSERPQMEIGGDLVINLSFDGTGTVTPAQLVKQEEPVDGEYKLISAGDGETTEES